MTDEDRKKYLAFLSFTQSQQQNYFGGLLNGREEGREEGIEIGIEKAQKEFVRKSLRKGLNIQTICDITELSEEQVRQIIQDDKGKTSTT
jgi:predicted transposase/invertase (TIGR01784 family)